MAIPVYMFTGFLESGKTQFIIDTLLDPGFTDGEKTLIVACEDGEIEYDKSFLRETNSFVFHIDSKDDFNKENLKNAVFKYKPDRIVLEYNGMWKIDLIYKEFPYNWDLYQIVTTINAETYALYLKNMGSKIIEHVGVSELVVFNRCTQELREYIRSTNVLAMNPRAMIFLEDENGNSEQYDKNLSLPYDIDAEVLEIEDTDFGIFYVDVMSNPAKYEGKTVKAKVLVHRREDFTKDCFSAGRFAMVCCADDITYIAIYCYMPEAAKLVKERSWANITADVEIRYIKELNGEGAVLRVKSYEESLPPQDDLIYFR